MNFLQLAQRLRERAGIQGAQGSPTTVVAQTGEMLRVVNWINSAWVDVQAQHEWNFRYGDFSFDTISAVYWYPESACGLEANTSLSRWLTDTFRCYLTATGVSDEQFLSEYDYDDFRDHYEFGSNESQRPSVFAIKAKDRSILLGPVPDDVYTIRGQYIKAALEMTVADASEPSGLPTEFQMMIVYKAMMKYASYEAAPEVMSEAQAEYNALLARAERVLLPEIRVGAPLA